MRSIFRPEKGLAPYSTKCLRARPDVKHPGRICISVGCKPTHYIGKTRITHNIYPQHIRTGNVLRVQYVYIVGDCHPQYIRTHNIYMNNILGGCTHNIYPQYIPVVHNIYAPTRYTFTIYTHNTKSAPTIYTQNGHSSKIYDCTHNIYDYIVGGALARPECIVGADVYIVGNNTYILWVTPRNILWTTYCG